MSSNVVALLLSSGFVDDDDDVCQFASTSCYLVGCNAAGQTILSYAASLVPNLLGYCGDAKQLDESQRDALRLLSIRRFAE